MIKYFDSTPQSITKWAYQKKDIKSTPEWDTLITTIENGDLLEFSHPFKGIKLLAVHFEC